jgi:hypothetical protein
MKTARHALNVMDWLSLQTVASVCGRSAEDARRASDVVATVIVLRKYREADALFDLDAKYIRMQEIQATNSAPIGKGKYSRQYGCAWMYGADMGIIEIKHV